MRRIAIPFVAAVLAAFALPSGASAALDGEDLGDEFRITGDGADDRVAAISNGGLIAFDFGADGTVDRSVGFEAITSVAVELGPGNDSFTAIGNLASERWAVKCLRATM